MTWAVELPDGSTIYCDTRVEVSAVEELCAAGYIPRAPYPGTRRQSWPAECATCHQPRTVQLFRVAAGLRCAHRWGAGDPAAEALAAGYDPQEPYPGTTSALWKLRCMECGRPRTTSLGMIRRGVRCAHTNGRGHQPRVVEIKWGRTSPVTVTDLADKVRWAREWGWTVREWADTSAQGERVTLTRITAPSGHTVALYESTNGTRPRRKWRQ